ncbi:hypothetical protein JW859_04520 [bacterium]|nr:hypothetical protein [bacterium]
MAPDDGSQQELAEWRRLNNEWMEQWSHPVYRAIYLGEYDEAQAALKRAEAELAAGRLPADVAEAQQYNLVFTACRLHWDDVAGDGYDQDDYDRVMAELSQPAATEFGEGMRLSTYIRIKINGVFDGFDTLTGAECRSIIQRLPDYLLPPVVHQIAKLAFVQNDVELLGAALGELTINPMQRLGQATWQRANMLYQLLAGKATRRDVAETIKTLTVRPQLVDFHDTIWPACRAAGLVDADLEQLLAEREAEVLAKTEVPGPERRTKSFRGGTQ